MTYNFVDLLVSYGYENIREHVTSIQLRTIVKICIEP